jgi:ABC-type Fe3+/spermidine/putrescine transport system ATPase subunit
MLTRTSEAGLDDAVVRLANLNKTFANGRVRAVDDLTLSIGAGEVMTLLGPSGCGKTTTLRMVAGLETPDSGTIHFAREPIFDSVRGVSLPPEKRNLGMVFQSYAIWPHMTVGENVGFPLDVRGMPDREIADRVASVLDLVGLGGMEQRPATALSGGQQQRVALARAIILEPKLLLLDEPFSNLDAKLRETMRIEIKLLQRRLNLAVLFVTHDQVEALALSEKIAIVNRGRIEQQGPPRVLYEQPANEFVRDFVGKTLLFSGRIEAVLPQGQVSVAIEGGAPCVVLGQYLKTTGEVGGEVTVAVRPEDATVVPAHGAPPPGIIAGTVKTTLFLGEWIEYQVALEGQGERIVRGERRCPAREGDAIWLKVQPSGHTVWSK